MKTPLALIAALLLTSCVSSTSSEDLKKAIDQEVAQIEELKPTYETEERDSVLTSSQGGTDLAYYDMSNALSHEYMRELKKIETTLYGETGKTVMDFYYDESGLIYISEESTSYSTSIYDENFDQSKSTITVESFYFNQGTMFTWIDPQGGFVNPQSPEFKGKEEDWMKVEQTLTE